MLFVMDILSLEIKYNIIANKFKNDENKNQVTVFVLEVVFEILLKMQLNVTIS